MTISDIYYLFWCGNQYFCEKQMFQIFDTCCVPPHGKVRYTKFIKISIQNMMCKKSIIKIDEMIASCAYSQMIIKICLSDHFYNHLTATFFHRQPTYIQQCCFLTFFGKHLWVTTCICFFHLRIGASRILDFEVNIPIILFSGRRNSSQHDIPNFSNISPKKYCTLIRIIFKIVTNSFELNAFLFGIKRA